MLLISQAVQSNLPLGEAIRLLVSGGKNNRLNRSLLRFAALLDEGLEPQTAVRKAKLPRRLTALLETAFKSGNFPEYFAELTETEQERSKTFQILTNLLAYPILLFGITLAVVEILAFTTWKFEAIFLDFDMNLPLLTERVIIFSRMLAQPETYFILIGGILVLFLLIRLFFSSFWFRIPILGTLFCSLASQKLLRQLLFSIKRGVPLDQALELAAGSFSFNRAYRTRCLKAAALAKEGTKFSQLILFFPLIFPRWLVPFIQTAEKNDTIPSALQRSLEVLKADQIGSAFLFYSVFIPTIYLFLFFVFMCFTLALLSPFVGLVTALSG
ncbi:MAG: type II secretion system F family protein [Planctomycetaceae bacterium]|nr:type II secretion system F family protein [Planctomycetaceae bacterium]